MSRSGYSDDIDNWALIRWRGQVASSIRGIKGQAFLKELIFAMDAMANKRLIAHELRKDGEVCALGVIGSKRNLPLEEFDPYDHGGLASEFLISHQLIQEIEYINDSGWRSPEDRWKTVYNWAKSQIREPKA